LSIAVIISQHVIGRDDQKTGQGKSKKIRIWEWPIDWLNYYICHSIVKGWGGERELLMTLFNFGCQPEKRTGMQLDIGGYMVTCQFVFFPILSRLFFYFISSDDR
jgi:hypothetical protein